METIMVCWSSIGIIENEMETTIVYWGYTGIMPITWKLLYYTGVILGL